MGNPHWGDVPTWVTAGVALAALIAAVRAYRAQSAGLKKQRDQLADQQEANRKQAEGLDLQAQDLRASLQRLEREREGQRSAQAKQVFIKVDRESEGLRADGSAKKKVTATVRNGSRHPVYDLPGEEATSERHVALAVKLEDACQAHRRQRSRVLLRRRRRELASPAGWGW